MKRTRPAQRKRPQRRWHLPPPLLHGSEALEGGQILQEVKGELGVALWQGMRDVMLWAQAPVGERAHAFSPGAEKRRLQGAGGEDEVLVPLRQLVALVANPGAGNPTVIALACRQIAQWAESRGHSATALSFAQCASLSIPADVGAAYAIARLAQESGDAARAEVWYRRTIGLARQTRDWRLYSRAFRGLGLLAGARGDSTAARYHLVRALRGGRRGGMRQEQAAALHELFLLAARTGRLEEADRLAVAAFEAYGSRDARLRALAGDVAQVWMRHGRSAEAEPLLQALELQANDDPLTPEAEQLSPAARRAAASLASSLAGRIRAVEEA
jgi:hypothetical protein